ncbi:hypothetical protein GCM10009566_11900 [Streptomyces murinus]
MLRTGAGATGAIGMPGAPGCGGYGIPAGACWAYGLASTGPGCGGGGADWLMTGIPPCCGTTG